MFILRLNRLRVFDNRTRKSFLGLFGDDSTDLKIVSFIATEQTMFPDFDRFILESNPGIRRQILSDTIEETLSRRVFTTIPDVRDGHLLTFGDAGFALHQGEMIPSALDWTMLVIKSNQAARNFGVLIGDLLGDEQYPAFEANLLATLKGIAATTNPSYLAASRIARFIGESAAAALKRKEDELIGLYYNSLNRIQHYPHGERKYDGSPGVTGNIAVDYSLFGVPSAIPRAIVVEEQSEVIIPLTASLTHIPSSLPPKLLRRRVKAANMAGEPVYRFADEKPFFFEAGMTIDVDGSPRAYHPQKGKGLDLLGNAGKQGRWWGLATDNGKMSGTPVIQKMSDPAPGFYVSTTSLCDKSKGLADPARYVDAESIPFIVLPRSHGSDALTGDLGVVINLKTQQHVGVIFADIGPKGHLGEASMAAARAIGIDDNPRSGGQADRVFYLVFPGSGDRKPLPASTIKSRAESLFAEWGGIDALRQATGAQLVQPQLIESGLEVVSGDLAAFAEQDHTLPLADLKHNRPLAREIQQLLAAQGFIDPPIDGKWGPISSCGWTAFCKLLSIKNPQALDKTKAKRLLATKQHELVPLDLDGGDPFASKICRYMIARGMWFARAKGMSNIVYLEGVNPDGSLNKDRPNRFNDLRLLLNLTPGGRPIIRGIWEATTEPGKYYTENRLNSEGAARIQFGQNRAWRVGLHRNDHEALRQARPITVHRDGNEDYLRPGDLIRTGQFFINQHWGYNAPLNDIGRASAGCLVGRTKKGHREFMKKIKSDIRHKASSSYLFYTAVLDGREVLADD